MGWQRVPFNCSRCDSGWGVRRGPSHVVYLILILFGSVASGILSVLTLGLFSIIAAPLLLLLILVWLLDCLFSSGFREVVCDKCGCGSYDSTSASIGPIKVSHDVIDGPKIINVKPIKTMKPNRAIAPRSVETWWDRQSKDTRSALILTGVLVGAITAMILLATR